MSKKPDLFARFSLDYADHPKIASLSDAAFRAHVTLILYSRKYKTDGVIKNPVANRVALQWDTDVLSELQNNDDDDPSLEQLESGDYYLTGFEEMQETRAEIEERRARNQRNGAKGGRPKGSKNKTKRTQPETQSVSESDTQSQTESGTQKKPETETEVELTINPPTPPGGGNSGGDDQQPIVEVDQPAPPAPKRKTKPAANAHNTDPEFAKFWEVYPLKKSKKAAYSAYLKALEIVDQETLIAGAASYRDDPSRNPDKTKHPSTWLNQHCWEDEPGPAAPPANWIPNQYPAMSASDRRLAEVQEREQRILAGEFQHLTENQPYAPLRAVEGGNRFG